MLHFPLKSPFVGTRHQPARCDCLVVEQLILALLWHEFLQQSNVLFRFANQQLGTALLLSSWKGSEQSVSYLLEMGADPNARDPAGRTSLHLAAVNGKIDISKKLLECGAKVRSNSV